MSLCDVMISAVPTPFLLILLTILSYVVNNQIKVQVMGVRLYSRLGGHSLINTLAIKLQNSIYNQMKRLWTTFSIHQLSFFQRNAQ